MLVDIKEVVSKGIELLDTAVPDWRESVNSETLDMGVYDRCVLGQIYTDYSEGMYQLFDRDDAATAMQYGFNYDLPEYDDEEYQEAMRLLRDEWLLALA